MWQIRLKAIRTASKVRAEPVLKLGLNSVPNFMYTEAHEHDHARELVCSVAGNIGLIRRLVAESPDRQCGRLAYHRLHCAAFKHLYLPSGSGFVESVMRLIVNLRLKSPSIFWKRKIAETILFRGSKVSCGRWTITLENLMARSRCGLYVGHQIKCTRAEII